jgi:nucleotide-binding universal stress UspA family protein
MDKRKKRILVAIDHSGQSLESAAYISRMVDPLQYDVVLFHVESDLYDIFYDYDDKPPLDLPGALHFSDWVEAQNRSIDINLDQARKCFTDAGFPPDSILIHKQPRVNGIARDIIAESQNGYDLLVAGKSGINKVSDSLTGTVTSKLLTRTFHIPLVIVAGTPDTEKVLVGYDGSKGSNQAVAMSAWHIRKTVREILLCHVIRSFNLSETQFSLEYASFYNTFLPEMEEALIKLRRDKMEPLLNAARQVYINSGYPGSIVRWGLINRGMSRSKALIEMAKDQKCGTLILGRRGQSAVEEFFIGRVGKKAVEMAKSLAIWII